jgi:hypothetical protein
MCLAIHFLYKSYTHLGFHYLLLFTEEKGGDGERAKADKDPTVDLIAACFGVLVLVREDRNLQVVVGVWRYHRYLSIK